ncbi:AIPR family protein [Actinobacillus equuli]|uniref:AIPR family protein n=1 Tax=Actinobacillus equuli subsp. equuli TaxID=202947 RepID=A0A9X4G2F5_ACTEU|nr:AIPR family protein [Actinobacillus equuli]MDE8034567.1 AIPR family protein [Actinobacillus equuli subsp. equuli]MDG4948792.1 AIPR family protein [Actinobacillus equuli subsp. haemolyticus]WGE42740.1 AIPR family protein [Actinobacillus equuli subsp. haemolyticus]WGE59650.1 AIPR family protein [Actinobacillus equuli subsp. haemolyticus]WGE61707.1 AIPR family protein [Actinobacillus equuli subsp. haemolyticus]
MGKIEEPIFAYTGTISGIEVYQWYQANHSRLFTKNIRKMLGNTDINKEIENTIKHQPELFWYFNNGLTLIADSIEKSIAGGSSRDIGTFKAINANVVNGAQTVSTIGEMENTETNLVKLEQVKIPIRIISLNQSDENFGAKVTKNNNRQNKIENRDFVVLDDLQIALRTELAINGIEYNLSRTEDFNPSETAFDINEAVVALACASNNPSLAVQAKREIGKFYESLEKAPYTQIFNIGLTGAYMFHTVSCLRHIDQLIDESISILEKRSGRRYGILVHGNRMLALLILSKLGIHLNKNHPTFQLPKTEIDSNFSEILNKLETEIENNFNDKMLATLFKNQTICRTIFSNILS